MALFTFGYEGLTIEVFIARLLSSRVQEVIDVRELPLSRKRGFSKNALALAREEAGISYRHLPVFGCPRPVRNRYKADADWNAYTVAFLSYLGQQKEAIATLADDVKNTTACLICFEADYALCHRSMVADAVRQAGGPPVKHLKARAAVADAVGQRAA